MDLRLKRVEERIAGETEVLWILYEAGCLMTPLLIVPDHQLKRLFDEWKKESK